MSNRSFIAALLIEGGAGMATALAAPVVPPPCNCVELPGYAQLVGMTDLNVQLNDRFAVNDGRSFYRSPAQIESYRLKIEAQRLALKSCPSQDRARSWKTFMRLSSESLGAGREKDDALGEPASFAEIYGGKFANKEAAFRSHIQTSSLSGLQAELTSGGRADARLDAILLKVVFRRGDESLEKALAPYVMLSTEQKVALVLKAGDLASGRYDQSKFGTLARTPYSAEKVVSSVGDGVLDSVTGGSRPSKAGDCADIANTQAAMLQALGMKDVYVVFGANLKSPHTTVIARDSERPNSFIKINYARQLDATNQEGGKLLGVASANTGMTDNSISYHIAKPNGRTVAHVPSEIGKVMAEAAGMDIRKIEPLARPSSSLAGVQLALPGARSAQLFTGRDSSGNLYGGGAMTQAWNQGGNFPGRVGAVAAVRRSYKGLAVSDFYAHLQQEARTPDIEVWRGIRARIDASMTVMAHYGNALGESQSTNVGLSGSMLGTAGAQVSVGDPNSAVSGRVRTEIQAAPGLENMGGTTPNAYINHLMFSAEGRAQLGQTPQGRAYLIAATSVLLDHFGPRVLARVGVETPRVGARVEVVGRVNEETPTFKDGSLRQARAAVGVNVTDYLQISVEGETLLEDAPPSLGIRGGIQGRF